jgi:sterol 14-demethylase
MTTPPVVSGGLPIVGHALQMMQDRTALFERGYREHGKLFTVKLGPQNAVVLGDKDHNRIFYQETDKKLNMSEVYDFLLAAFGEVLFTAGVELYNNQRPVLLAVFKRERMERYIEAMNQEVKNWLDTLGEHGEIDISAEMVRLTQFVAARAFMGDNFHDELKQDFWDAYADIGRSLDPVLPASLPLPKFRRRDRARQHMNRVFRELVAKRRANMDAYDDIITLMLTIPKNDGTIMDEDEIGSLFAGLLFAGHETTAGQAAWTIIQLLQNPDYLALVQAEIDNNMPADMIFDAKTLHDLDHLHWAIEETTRLRPSADLQMRQVKEPIQVGDYTIPAGWRMIVSDVIAHYDPDVYSNPRQYDPLRFSPERNEGKNPFAIMGFGGGIHKCTGINFAKNEMAIITSHLLKRYNLELKTQTTRIEGSMGANRPSKTILRYQRK